MAQIIPLNTVIQSPFKGINLGLDTKLDLTALREELAKAKAAKLERYKREYNLPTLTDEEAAKLSRAEREMRECNDCVGNCTKIARKYYQPVVKVENGHLVFGEKLCPVGRVIFGAKCEKAGIPRRYIGKSLAGYEVTDDNREAVQMARWYVAERPERSLFYYGATGTGKTFLASLIAQAFVRDSKSVIFGDVPSLLKRIKECFDNKDDSASEVISRYCKCKLLVLDDVGAGQITEWNVGILYEIINTRYNANKPLIATSNLDMKGLENLFRGKGDALIAGRIISRLSEMCEQAFFGTKDRRRL